MKFNNGRSTVYKIWHNAAWQKIKPEAQVIEDIKKNYKKDVEKLFLDQFTIMLQKLNAKKEEYGVFKRYDYYFILGLWNHCDIFMEDFF